MTRPMTDNKDAARARGQALRSERAARARTIRRGIVSGALALFVAAWLMITIVLVSGHVPALARKASTASTASTASSAATVASTPSTTTTTSGSGSTGSDSSSSSASDSSSGSSSNSSGVSSVTTSQS